MASSKACWHMVFVFGEVVEELGDAAQLWTEFAESFYRT